jgi:hypothetical protein
MSTTSRRPLAALLASAAPLVVGVALAAGPMALGAPTRATAHAAAIQPAGVDPCHHGVAAFKLPLCAGD